MSGSTLRSGAVTVSVTDVPTRVNGGLDRHTGPAVSKGEPKLQNISVPAEIRAAAVELLALSQGNDVSVASFKTDPAKLAEFMKNKAALTQFLEKTGMNISDKVPRSADAVQTVKPFHGDAAKALYDFAEVPSSIPETPESRAAQARAKVDAKTISGELKKTGGQLYVINWNNQDDTTVNIVAAINKKTGQMTFVKAFPAI